MDLQQTMGGGRSNVLRSYSEEVPYSYGHARAASHSGTAHRNTIATTDYRYDSRTACPPVLAQPIPERPLFQSGIPQSFSYPSKPRSASDSRPYPVSTVSIPMRGEDAEQTPVARFGAGLSLQGKAANSNRPRSVSQPEENLNPAAKYECNYCGKGFNRPSSLKVSGSCSQAYRFLPSILYCAHNSSDPLEQPHRRET
jgi:hypothetical protein